MIKVKDVYGNAITIPEEILVVMNDDGYELLGELEVSASAGKPLHSTEQFYHGSRVYVRKGAYSRPEFMEYIPKGKKEPSLVYRVMGKHQYQEQLKSH